MRTSKRKYLWITIIMILSTCVPYFLLHIDYTCDDSEAVENILKAMKADLDKVQSCADGVANLKNEVDKETQLHSNELSTLKSVFASINSYILYLKGNFEVVLESNKCLVTFLLEQQATSHDKNSQTEGPKSLFQQTERKPGVAPKVSDRRTCIIPRALNNSDTKHIYQIKKTARKDKNLPPLRGNQKIDETRFIKKGILVAQMQGRMQEELIAHMGQIGPWNFNRGAGEKLIIANKYFNIAENGTKIYIVLEGLYFIYVQVYYMTSDVMNAYKVIVNYNGQDKEHIVAECSSSSSHVHLLDVTCFTAVPHYLQPGDEVYVTQNEGSRHILFLDGKTYLGLILFNAKKEAQIIKQCIKNSKQCFNNLHYK